MFSMPDDTLETPAGILLLPIAESKCGVHNAPPSALSTSVTENSITYMHDVGRPGNAKHYFHYCTALGLQQTVDTQQVCKIKAAKTCFATKT
jgi:hypothetical protein